MQSWNCLFLAKYPLKFKILMINPLTFSSKQQISTYNSSEEVLSKVFSYRKIIHCVEIITTNKNLLPPPDIDSFEQVLLKTSIFDDESAVEELLKPTTIFISLSPLKRGNTLTIQDGKIIFTLNATTHERFGLQCKKYKDIFYVSIYEEDKEKLRRIRPCEAIEGLLLCADRSSIEDYIIKSAPVEQNYDGWAPAKPISFDISLLEKKETYPANWKKEFPNAVDDFLLKRNLIEVKDDFQRFTITGCIKVQQLKEWIESLGKDSFVMMMIWDFKNTIGSFIGKDFKLEGFGGGSETVVFGDKVSKPFKIQTIENIDEE